MSQQKVFWHHRNISKQKVIDIIVLLLKTNILAHRSNPQRTPPASKYAGHLFPCCLICYYLLAYVHIGFSQCLLSVNASATGAIEANQSARSLPHTPSSSWVRLYILSVRTDCLIPMHVKYVHFGLYAVLTDYNQLLCLITMWKVQWLWPSPSPHLR